MYCDVILVDLHFTAYIWSMKTQVYICYFGLGRSTRTHTHIHMSISLQACSSFRTLHAGPLNHIQRLRDKLKLAPPVKSAAFCTPPILRKKKKKKVAKTHVSAA